MGALLEADMHDAVRDALGVDGIVLPDAVIDRLPSKVVTRKANRLVPGWAMLADNQRGDFDIAVIKSVAAECIHGLKTLYAPGEGVSDARGGQYDWETRLKRLTAEANAAWNRAAATLNTPATVITSYAPFQPYGRSKGDGFTSPDTFSQPQTVLNPFPELMHQV